MPEFRDQYDNRIAERRGDIIVDTYRTRIYQIRGDRIYDNFRIGWKWQKPPESALSGSSKHWRWIIESETA
jgi:hypothetical protein